MNKYCYNNIFINNPGGEESYYHIYFDNDKNETGESNLTKVYLTKFQFDNFQFDKIYYIIKNQGKSYKFF